MKWKRMSMCLSQKTAEIRSCAVASARLELWSCWAAAKMDNLNTPPRAQNIWIHFNQDMDKVNFLSTFRLYTPSLHIRCFRGPEFSENTQIFYSDRTKEGWYGLNCVYHHEIDKGSCQDVIWSDSAQKCPKTHLTFLLVT
jgi:hypothetical protein